MTTTSRSVATSIGIITTLYRMYSGDVGGQQCRERGGAVPGLANPFGRVGIGGRSGTALDEQGGAFVQQGPR